VIGLGLKISSSPNGSLDFVAAGLETGAGAAKISSSSKRGFLTGVAAFGAGSAKISSAAITGLNETGVGLATTGAGDAKISASTTAGLTTAFG